MVWRLVSVAVGLIFFCHSVYAQVVSDFTTNADGWTAPSALGGAPTYSSTGGNPGGYIQGQTPGSVAIGATLLWIPFYYEAPVKFEGDKSAYYGGNLRYDASQTTTGTGIQYPQVVITNINGVSIYYYPPTPVEPPAFGTWQTFSIKLNNAGNYWKTDDDPASTAASAALIQSVLSGIAALQIQGLYRNANISSRIDNVTMYPPLIIDTQPDWQFLCEGEVASFTTEASNNSNITYHWQHLDSAVGWLDMNNGGGYQGVLTNTLTFNTTGPFGAGGYRTRISGIGVDDVYSFEAGLVVYDRPGPPTAIGATSCDPASVVLTASGGTVEMYRWYTVETGGTAIDGEYGESFDTPVLNATTTYYVANTAVAGNNLCESVRTEVIAHIGPPDPPTATGAQSCTAAAIILTANGGASGEYRWFTQPTGGGSVAGQHSKTFLTPVISETTTYYVAIDNGLCISNRTPVVATIGGSGCTPVPSNSVIEVFNAVSPNKDGKNDVFFIRNIDTVTDAMKNHVTIFNRWGDLVWKGNDYNNSTVVFSGLSKNNTELPSGTYYYKIDFTSDKKSQDGYLSLKR